MTGRKTSENNEGAERILLVQGDKEFRVKVPPGAKVTFGPWSPSNQDRGFGNSGRQVGTLRIYRTEKDIIAVFSGVYSFRDISLEYQEKVTVEEGATIWKNDAGGYNREEKVKRNYEWEGPDLLPAASNGNGHIQEGNF